jgi:hypothetical protein
LAVHREGLVPGGDHPLQHEAFSNIIAYMHGT